MVLSYHREPWEDEETDQYDEHILDYVKWWYEYWSVAMGGEETGIVTLH